VLEVSPNRIAGDLEDPRRPELSQLNAGAVVRVFPQPTLQHPRESSGVGRCALDVEGVRRRDPRAAGGSVGCEHRELRVSGHSSKDLVQNAGHERLAQLLPAKVRIARVAADEA